MTDGEPLLVFGVLLGLVGATVLPFAIPAIQYDDRSVPTTTPSRDKSVPAGVSPVTTGAVQPITEAGRSTDSSTPTQRSTPTRTPHPTSTTANLRCDPPPQQGLPSEFPLEVEGTSISGEGVSVAVIDPSGFDVDDPRIAGAIAETKSFRSQGEDDITNGGATRHGTESAALISRIAPDASLYLANFGKAIDFTRAIEWAIEQDADVIVAPTTFYAKPNDGSAPVSRAVTEALEQGIPVIVPTGNVARNHWEGTYEGGTWLEFSPNDTRMYLRGTDRPVRTWLWWNETAESGPNEFRVVLYQDLGDRSKRIATSQDYPKGPVGANQVLFEQIKSNNFLSSSIGNGTYYLRIKGPDDVNHRVELVAAAHRLEAPVARGSLMAPATAKGPVIAVGAARDSHGRPLVTSSRGPTNDGRLGIDLLAPGTVHGAAGARFTGTSAATAYTGGIVALMAEVEPALTPARAEAILRATAKPPTSRDPNVSAGHGLIDPAAALDCVVDAPPEEGS